MAMKKNNSNYVTIKKDKYNDLKKYKSVNNFLFKSLFTNFFDSTNYRAIIFNDNGEEVATVNLDRTKKNFIFSNGLYNISWDYKTFFTRRSFFKRYKYFFYTLNNPNPIALERSKDVKFNANDYNQIFHSKIIKDINDINKNLLKELLTPKNILIGVAIIGALIYFLNGGTLT